MSKIYFTIREIKNQSKILGIGVQLFWWCYEWEKFKKYYGIKEKTPSSRWKFGKNKKDYCRNLLKYN